MNFILSGNSENYHVLNANVLLVYVAYKHTYEVRR